MDRLISQPPAVKYNYPRKELLLFFFFETTPSPYEQAQRLKHSSVINLWWTSLPSLLNVGATLLSTIHFRSRRTDPGEMAQSVTCKQEVPGTHARKPAWHSVMVALASQAQLRSPAFVLEANLAGAFLTVGKGLSMALFLHCPQADGQSMNSSLFQLN